MKTNSTIKLFSALLIAVLAVQACSPKQLPQKSFTAGEKALEREYLMVEANKFYLLGDLQTTVSILNQSIKKDSLCAACYYLRASTYIKGGAYANALVDADKAAALDTTNKWYTLLQAQLNAQVNNLDKATNLYEKLLVKEGYNTDIYYNLANLYGISNKLDKSAAALDTIELHEGNSEQLVLARQQLYYRNGDTDKALLDGLELNREFPGNPQYLTIVGDVYLRKGELDEAKSFYDNAHQIDSLYPPAQFGRLEVARKKEDYVSYFTNLKQLCNNDRVDLSEKISYLSLVVSDPTLGEVSKIWMNDILKDMSADYSKIWAFNVFYASYLVHAQQPDDAVKLINGFMDSAKPVKSPEVWAYYLSLLNDAQKWDDLTKGADQAIAQVGKEPSFYMFKSISQWQAKNIKGAIATLDEASKLKTVDTAQRSDIYGFLGDLYAQDGNNKKAYASYDKALALTPNNVVVLNNYAYHLSVEGERLKDALNMAKKVAEKEPSNPTYLDTYGWIYYKMGLYSEAKDIFRQVIVYGGRTESVPLDHYGDVLYALGEYDTAIIYWEFAIAAKDCENPNAIKQKITNAKTQKN